MDARSSTLLALVWPVAVVGSALGLLVRWAHGSNGARFDELMVETHSLVPLGIAIVVALGQATRTLHKVLADGVPVVLAALPLIIPGLITIAVVEYELRALFEPSTHCGPAVWTDVVTGVLGDLHWVRAIVLTIAGSGLVWLSVVASTTVKRAELVARTAMLIGLAGVGVSLLASARASAHVTSFLTSSVSSSEPEWGALAAWREATEAANTTLLFAAVLFVAGAVHAQRHAPVSWRPIGAVVVFAVAIVGLRGAAAASDKMLTHQLEEHGIYSYETYNDVRATPQSIRTYFDQIKTPLEARYRRPVTLRVDLHDAVALTESIDELRALGERDFVVAQRSPFIAPSKVFLPAELLLTSRQRRLWVEPSCRYVAERRHGQLEIVADDRVPLARATIPLWDRPRHECVELPWRGRSLAELLEDADAVSGQGYRAMLVSTR